MSHSTAVQELYMEFQELCDREDTYWDSVHREVSYFAEDTCPVGASPRPKGREVGEFDVILVNFDDRNGYYCEIKTSGPDVKYGYQQIDRAKYFFPGTLQDEDEWAIIGDVYLENDI